MSELNDRRLRDRPPPPNSALSLTQTSALKGRGLFSLSTHGMIISTSVPLSIWVLKPGMLSSPSWSSIWAIFQELLYEAKPQRFHLSLEFTLPLICILSLSTKVLFFWFRECCTHCLSPLPNTPHPVLSFRPSLKEVWNSECVLSSHYFYLFPDFTYFLTILLSRVSSRMHRGLPGISDTCQIYMIFLSFIAGKQYNFSFQNQYILPLPTNYHS